MPKQFCFTCFDFSIILFHVYVLTILFEPNAILITSRDQASPHSCVLINSLPSESDDLFSFIKRLSRPSIADCGTYKIGRRIVVFFLLSTIFLKPSPLTDYD
uniref:Uncharacterized protein n=1 Tax=Cacopsylla melanoneura TaxID=428564 RepID=A0A8D9BVN8_9HEMI